MYTESNPARLVVAFVLALGLFVFPSVATATVTSTSITAPGNNSYVVWDSRTDTGTSPISGIAPGAVNGDLVDILCYTPRGYTNTAAEDVPVTAGQFSISDLSNVSGSICRLRAVPAGTEPTDVSPFAGPITSINEIYVTEDNWADPGNLKPNGYSVDTGQFKGYMDWGDAMCALETSLVDLESFTETEEVFYCAHRFSGVNDLEPDVDPSKSAVQIDGADGWLTSNLRGAAFEHLPSFPGVTIAPNFNLSNGNLQLATTEEIVTCTADTDGWWEPGQDCPPLLDTGVRLDRTITQSHAGEKAVVVDRWVSTDGQSHSISLDYREEFQFADGGSPNARYIFPGPTTYDGPADGTVVPGAIPAGTTIYAHDPAYADGSTEVGRAGFKLVSGADSAEFESDGYDAPIVKFRYIDRTIPAGGALEVTTEFYQSFTQARLEELAAGAPDPTGGDDDTPTGGGTTPPADTSAAKPTISGPFGVKAAASRGKRPRVTVTTGRSVNCPAGGSACTASAALTTKLKTRVKGKTRTKTVKLGTFTFSIPAGTSKKLSFKLAAKHTKLFRANRSLKLSALISASAGSGSAVLAADSYTAKRPRFKK